MLGHDIPDEAGSNHDANTLNEIANHVNEGCAHIDILSFVLVCRGITVAVAMPVTVPVTVAVPVSTSCCDTENIQTSLIQTTDLDAVLSS